MEACFNWFLGGGYIVLIIVIGLPLILGIVRDRRIAAQKRQKEREQEENRRRAEEQERIEREKSAEQKFYEIMYARHPKFFVRGYTDDRSIICGLCGSIVLDDLTCPIDRGEALCVDCRKRYNAANLDAVVPPPKGMYYSPLRYHIRLMRIALDYEQGLIDKEEVERENALAEQCEIEYNEEKNRVELEKQRQKKLREEELQQVSRAIEHINVPNKTT